ncbi:hypothetical protein ASE95_01190 [Sphingomonas sp. Leaf231]|uniref:AMP-binding protein n=1 Tax=Sphingomonas sp. Leaf231 TaxID=1736301 RepID=UPI0006F668D5|nr:AMP-binding protein [Sphingomonas sp. Leaf231]KQN93589.1 hypothetical protein ASE95_01190 [Sphingomonas sp. Leaf231]
MTPVLSRATVQRIACAVVAAEVRRVRGSALPLPHQWPETMAIGDDGLGLDSLEQLGALGALAETFGLDDTMLGREPPRTVGAWIDWIMGRFARGGGHVTVRTSGSTGRPVPCTHALADLLAETQFLAGYVHERRRVVALVPAHHLYGMIWTALLPAVLDIPVVTRTVGASLELAPGDLVIAVPDQWQAILSLTRGFPTDLVGVSSGGPLNDALAADLLASGVARLLDIYGSSETGGIALREVPARSYRLLPRWQLLARDDGDWELGDDRGWRHDLPDRIERVGERDIRPTGRRDGAVQVGGHNVWPTRVADMLRTLEGVADAAVRLHVSGRLKAYIVPAVERDRSQLTTMIERAVADRLSMAERPVTLTFGSTLPRNVMGKLEDWT